MDLEGSLIVRAEADIVHFAFEVTNAGEAPRELRYRDGQAAEFVVQTDERDVWRWSEGRMFTQAFWEEALGPGETVAYEASWEDPKPGTYTATATLQAQEATLTARRDFEIEPR